MVSVNKVDSLRDLQSMEDGRHGVNGLNVLCLATMVFKQEFERAPIQCPSTMVLPVQEIAQLSDHVSHRVQVSTTVTITCYMIVVYGCLNCSRTNININHHRHRWPTKRRTN